MMCLKDLLLYMVLLPIPSASPVFVGLYWLAVILAIRPCGYCIALFALINLSTSPSSPFVNLPIPQIPVDPLRPLTSPISDRSWLTLNEGRWWDPAIMGYQEIAKIHALERNSTDDQATAIQAQTDDDSQHMEDTRSRSDEKPAMVGSIWDKIPWRRSAIASSSTSILASAPSTSPSSPDPGSETELSEDLSTLPPGYIDLRWRGLGFVLDIGFARSEQGLKWEIADTKRAIQYDREAKKSRQRYWALVEERENERRKDAGDDGQQEKAKEVDSTDGVEEKDGLRWLDRVRLFGSW